MACIFIKPVAHGANYIKVVSSCKVTPNRQRIMSQLPNKNLKIYLPFCHIQLPYFLPVTVDRFSARAGHINIVFTIFEPFAKALADMTEKNAPGIMCQSGKTYGRRWSAA